MRGSRHNPRRRDRRKPLKPLNSPTLCILALLGLSTAGCLSNGAAPGANLISTPAFQASIPLPPPRHAGVYVVAHRGAHIGIPENTLAAYQKAIELGCDFVEIDVQTTKDGRFVSMHNSEVGKYAPDGSDVPVRQLTLAQLKTVDIGSRVGPEWRDERIPTFEEILELCKGRCGIYIDVKDAPIAALVEMVKDHGMEHHVLWYAGYNQLAEVERLIPGSMIMPDPDERKNLAPLLERFQPKIIAAVWENYSRRFVEQCHEAGAAVIVDEGEPDCWANALAWGSDGIQTDDPQGLIAFLEGQTRH